MKTSPPPRETWNLEDLFADSEAFLRSRDEVKRSLPDLDRHRGTLAESASALASALNACDVASRDLNRLYVYASMWSDTDTRVAEYHGMRQVVELLWNEFARKTSYLRPEILAMDPARLESFLAEDGGLGDHAFFLRNLIRQREHVLGPSEEKILAEAGLITGAANHLYNLMHNAELPRPEATLSDGTQVRLTPAEFSRHRTTSNRGDRLLLFQRYLEAYERFKGTLGLNLYEGVKAHMFRARSRGYGSCLASALDGDNIPETVYRNLIDQVRANLEVLHRYMRLRGRALGLERVGYHDLHCPLAPSLERNYTVRDAAELVLRAMKPLGPVYEEALRASFEERWIDWHPTEGKRSGAYASGAAYDVHPYVLLNFNGDYESVSTLAHEMGHALHSYFSNRKQPHATADYSIFVAEVASTFNEALLNARMFEEAGTDEERLFLVGTWLDQLRATLFRQTMFAEFELRIHETAEGGEALTGESLSAHYLRILRDYQGHDRGVMEIPALYGIEWAGVPHFYYDFYVYQYSTGIVAATALSEAVLEGKEGACERYLEFLGSGGSDYPLELLRRAGVDLESPEPYRATLGAMSRQLDRLEELLDRLGR